MCTTMKSIFFLTVAHPQKISWRPWHAVRWVYSITSPIFYDLTFTTNNEFLRSFSSPPCMATLKQDSVLSCLFCSLATTSKLAESDEFWMNNGLLAVGSLLGPLSLSCLDWVRRPRCALPLSRCARPWPSPSNPARCPRPVPTNGGFWCSIGFRI